MGLTKVTTKISHFSKTQPAYETDFLVDTGAIDCMAPESKVVAAGIAVEGKEVYELANGQPVEYSYGFARVEFMGAAETISHQTVEVCTRRDCPKKGEKADINRHRLEIS